MTPTDLAYAEPHSYDPGRPREALLVDASGTFRGRNRYHFLFPVLGCVGIGVAAGLSWRLRGRRRAGVAL